MEELKSMEEIKNELSKVEFGKKEVVKDEKNTKRII